MLKNILPRSVVLALVCSTALCVHAAEPGRIDVPAGDLKTALESFARQAGVELMYNPDQLKGLRTLGVSGELSPHDAVLKLLEGTSLKLSTDETGAMLIAPQREAASSGRQVSPEKRIEVEEILVTGSHIRGASPTSSVITVTQGEMRLGGLNTLGDVARSLPQNFSGGQNPGVAVGATAGGLTNRNDTGGSSFNLRGLGPDATLTLLNGARLPYDGLFQATDVSVIPVAAVDRVEILLDGASAIYGSDAVGGVANIILKRDYRGAELAARVGTATDGGYDQTQYTAVAGTTWDSGGLLVIADTAHNDPVRASQRDYVNYLSVPQTMLYPQSTQSGVTVSGHQGIGEIAEMTMDAFYSERRITRQSLTTTISRSAVDSTIWGVSPAVTLSLPADWSLKLHGFSGRDESKENSRELDITTGAQTFQFRPAYFNRVETAGVDAEGALFNLPGGAARLSAGGGYRRNHFENQDLLSGATTTSAVARSHYFYGEIDLPLVNRLGFNGALRYESYDSFGETTVPKLGLVWGITRSLEVRASWGRSFKIPTLFQQYTPPTLFLLRSTSFAGAPAGRTVMLRQGGNADLEPERAEVITAGITFEPEVLPGAALELNWFDIDYIDRIVQPHAPFSTALVTASSAGFVTLNPTPEQLAAAFADAGRAEGSFTGNSSGAPYNPASVYAVVDNAYANAAVNRQRGIDLSIRYAAKLLDGQLTLKTNATWITDSVRQLTTLAPEQQTSGVVFFPAKFKGAIGASWSRKGLTLSSTLWHIDGVVNNLVATRAAGDSMTTLDLVLDYQRVYDLIGEVGLNLAVTNVLNERPPFMQPVQPYFVNYDSTNYSALGRVINATIVKKF